MKYDVLIHEYVSCMIDAFTSKLYDLHVTPQHIEKGELEFNCASKRHYITIYESMNENIFFAKFANITCNISKYFFIEKKSKFQVNFWRLMNDQISITLAHFANITPNYIPVNISENFIIVNLANL